MLVFLISVVAIFLAVSLVRGWARSPAGGTTYAVGRALRRLWPLLLFIAALKAGPAAVAALMLTGLGYLAWKSYSSPLGQILRAGIAMSRAQATRAIMIERRMGMSGLELSGLVVAGAFRGRQLDSLDAAQCLALYGECRRRDPGGAALLQIYLDRRFAAWRHAEQAQDQWRGNERGRSGGAGGMSAQEAHEVLDVKSGASEAEIIRAHRKLMKQSHPDRGGSNAAAARVNQAKDVLMQRHRLYS